MSATTSLVAAPGWPGSSSMASSEQQSALAAGRGTVVESRAVADSTCLCSTADSKSCTLTWSTERQACRQSGCPGTGTGATDTLLPSSSAHMVPVERSFGAPCPPWPCGLTWSTFRVKAMHAMLTSAVNSGRPAVPAAASAGGSEASACGSDGAGGGGSGLL